ncbi:MAG: DUF1326 domain-containing protein [Nitrososphaeraceae archaeon]
MWKLLCPLNYFLQRLRRGRGDRNVHPCNFNGFPKYGFCQVLILYHIRSGSYKDTKLDGIDFIAALSWPKAYP